MNPMEFFRGQGRVSVESRDERGVQRPADGTNIVIMLRREAARVRKSLPALAMGALLAMPTASFAEAAPVKLASPSDIVRIADAGNMDLLPLVKYMDPAYFAHVGHLKIHDQAKNLHNANTPYSMLSFNSNQVSCEVNMVGMHKVNAMISNSPDKELDMETAIVLRHIVALHEVAHCEFGFGLIAGITGHNVNQPYIQSALLLEDIQREIPGLQDMSADLTTTLKERQADSKMLMLAALEYLNPAGGETGLREGHENFNRVLSLLKKLRAKDSEGWVGYNDHDTASVVDVVENLAKSAASSLDSARAFQEKFKSPAAVNEFTVQIAVGSMIQELPKIVDSLISDGIAAQKTALSKSPKRADKLIAEKKLSSYQSALALNQTYKFSVDYPLRKSPLAKQEFVQAVNSTWATYGPRSVPALIEEEDSRPQMIAPVMR